MKSESPVLSASLLKLRAPRVTDLPPLYALAEDHKHKFLDDYHDFDLEYAKRILNNPHTLIIDDHDYAVGVFWFDDTVDDLHSTIHMLIRPEYFRKFLKQGLGAEVINTAFESLGVLRLYGFPMSTQGSAIKILKKHHFYSHIPWRSHTKQQGKRVDTIFLELKRSTWEKKNGLR